MSRNPFGAMAPMLNTTNYCHFFFISWYACETAVLI